MLKRLLPMAAVAVVAGFALGATVFGPGSATAQETNDIVVESDKGAFDRWLDVLQPLVDDGTISSDQALAVAQHLASTHPGRGGHFPGRWPGLALFAQAADIIGIDATDLRAALADGQTLVEIAETNGVEVQTLIDGLLAALEEKLDQLVAEAKLSEERSDQILENATERIENFVNSEVHSRRGFWLRPRVSDSAGGTDA